MEEILKQINEDWSECSTDQEKIESSFDKLIKEKRADLFYSESDVKKKAEKQKKRLRSCVAMIESVEKAGSSNEELIKDLQEKKLKIKHYIKKLDVINKQTLNTGGKFVELFLGKESSAVLVGDDSKKFNFKKEYESFKYKCTVWNIPFTLLLYFFIQSRAIDTLYQLYLTYFYLTLALRENILAVNGSNIKAWWIRHHYLSIFLVITMLTWPETAFYQAYRPYFLLYALYASIVQVLQYKYQKERLYVRTAIGKSNMMDVANSDSSQVVVESSLALVFLLPFIFIGQIFQVYNAYKLFDWGLLHPESFGGITVEWQVYANGLLFLILALGNFVTTTEVLVKKVKRVKKRKQEKAALAKASEEKKIE
ncbi:predicted protein [Naegleria gruberi]|uniref:Predicted protein n=1 Tax=Naegleria gruberi TaxID=5762 RepID=D2VQV9_NAEGR|nr:uncharacterized protein NAEGRDRAFT_71364 [Naegleria gruberi]EFC40706.1 predicted protein [Naegleria gruberi]|eukprot:XP_002673450.1 predicted protein [Naegleria gruberi strain NEG-M]